MGDRVLHVSSPIALTNLYEEGALMEGQGECLRCDRGQDVGFVGDGEPLVCR